MASKFKRAKGHKLKKATAAPPMPTMAEYKPKPVGIHIHAEGEHMKAAHKDLAAQLKPLGFVKKKTAKPGAKKTIGDALSS